MGALAFAFSTLLTPGVSGDKDASEFALVLATLGVAHPTGYPLYTLTGWGFVHALRALGAGPDWAANLWSGVGAGVAVALTHALASRLLAWQGLSTRAATAVAALPALALATHPVWTDEATLAEVNTWHGAWTAGAALAFVSLLAAADRETSAREAGAPITRRAAGWGLIAGAGLAHHLTSVLTLGPLTLALVAGWIRAKRWRWRALAVGLACAALPVASYLYVAWRAFHPAEIQWPTLAPDWKSIADHLTGAEYRIYLGRFAPDPGQRRLLATFLYPWLVPGVALLAWWGLAARRTPGPVRAGMAAAVAAGLAYAFSYGVPDPSSYFLPPFLLTLAIAPAAVVALPGSGRFGRPMAAVAALAIGIGAFACAGRGLERAAVYRGHDRLLHSMWSSIPVERGFVVWNDDMYIHLREYQLMRGEKPGLEVVRPIQLTHDLPRRRFLERHGFDPVSRAAFDSAARAVRPRDVQELTGMLSDVIAWRINEESPLPVMIFDPGARQVRVLEKSPRR